MYEDVLLRTCVSLDHKTCFAQLLRGTDVLDREHKHKAFPKNIILCTHGVKILAIDNLKQLAR